MVNSKNRLTVHLLLNHLSDAEVVEPPKVVFGVSEALENETKTNTSVLSAYAVFMRAFRNFHDGSFQVLMSYWSAVRSGTRDVLACVGIGSVSMKCCCSFLLIFLSHCDGPGTRG